MNLGLLYWIIRIWIMERAEADDYFFGYLYMTIAANLFYIIFSLVAAVRARRGRMYYFLFFGRLSYESVFSMNRDFRYEGDPIDAGTNLPPQ
jgi:hypothetical protein